MFPRPGKRPRVAPADASPPPQRPVFETQTLITAEYDLGGAPISENSTLRSRVYAGVHKATGQRVAIKETWYRHGDGRSARVAKLEAGMLIRIARALPHNHNLVKYSKLYWDRDTHRHWVVLPWFEGNTLHDRIVRHADSRLPESDAQRLFAQLVNAIHGLHSIGITHRDIKPANVLLSDTSDSPVAVVADYGLADGDGFQDVFAGQRVGTLDYLAPEMVHRTNPRASFASDIWALGVVLYNMLSGRAPFDPAAGDVTDAIRNGKFFVPRRYFPGVSPAAKRLVYQCMQMQADARPTAEQLLDHPWVQQGSMQLQAVAHATGATTGAGAVAPPHHVPSPLCPPPHHPGCGMGAPYATAPARQQPCSRPPVTPIPSDATMSIASNITATGHASAHSQVPTVAPSPSSSTLPGEEVKQRKKQAAGCGAGAGDNANNTDDAGGPVMPKLDKEASDGGATGRSNMSMASTLSPTTSSFFSLAATSSNRTMLMPKTSSITSTTSTASVTLRRLAGAHMRQRGGVHHNTPAA